MTPARAKWCTKWRICGWSYWLSTSPSTMITFSLVHVHLICHCSAYVCTIFENIYFTS